MRFALSNNGSIKIRRNAADFTVRGAIRLLDPSLPGTASLGRNLTQHYREACLSKLALRNQT